MILAARAEEVAHMEITSCGGVAESRAWRQVLADVLQEPLRIARRPEGVAARAPMAAMIAAGIDFDRAQWTRPEDHVHPSIDLADATK